MTPLRQRMLEDMSIRNLTENTQLSYLLLRPDLISTQGPRLCEVEYGAASLSNFGGAHA